MSLGSFDVGYRLKCCLTRPVRRMDTSTGRHVLDDPEVLNVQRPASEGSRSLYITGQIRKAPIFWTAGRFL